MVFLGTRPHGPYPTFHNLGRETNLAPVHWTEDGWPVVGRNGQVPVVNASPTWVKEEIPCRWDFPVEESFDGETLSLPWNYLRNPDLSRYSLKERPGFLRLWGSAVNLSAADSPTWVGRRQQHHEMTAGTRLDFEPQREGEEAGLSVLMNERHHAEIAVTREHGMRQAIVRRTIGSLSVVVARHPLPPQGPVELEVAAVTPRVAGMPSQWAPEEPYYAFSVAVEGRKFLLAKAEMRYLATEVAGGFTGVYIGLYATGNGRPCGAPADFESFWYHPVVS